MQTKNYKLYFDFYHYVWDWALPLYINIEYLSHDYIEIQLHVLCFTLGFTRISHSYLKELNNILKEEPNKLTQETLEKTDKGEDLHVTEFKNKCYNCEHVWYANHPDELCPVCGEEDNIGTDFINGDA